MSDLGSDNEFDDFSPPPTLPPGVRKEVIKEADSDSYDKPKPGDEVKVDYVGKLEDGTEFDSSHSRDEPMVFTLGKGQVSKGWDLGIATMKKGEVAKFTLQPEFADGERGQPPSVPPNATVIFTIELISWISKSDLFGDGGVIKSLLEEGSGWDRPKKGGEVRISFKTLAEGGAVIGERSAIDYVPGCSKFGSISKVLDKALRSMKTGEKCSLKCSGDYICEGIVEIELTLEEVYAVEDVSFRQVGTVIKKQLKKGEAHGRPEDGCKVALQVESATDEAGAVLPGFVGPKVLSVRCGDGDMCDALECATVHMTKSERAVITCTEAAKACHSSLGLSEVTAKAAVFTVVLLDFETPQRTHSMLDEDKVNHAAKQKDAGTQLFKQKRFELALEKYKKVVSDLKDTNKFSDECRRQALELSKASELNVGACYLKLNDFNSTLTSCSKILKDDHCNIKALFRRAKAHYGRADYAEAMRDLDRTLELDGENSEAKALLPHVRKAQKKADNASKSTFSKMCAGFGKMESPRESKKPEPQKKEEEEPKEPVDTVAVTFRLDQKLEEGEHFRVVGAPEVLGSWDAERSVEMCKLPSKYEPPTGSGRKPPEQHLWEATVDIPQGEGKVEYKYLIRGPGGDRLETACHKVNVGGMGGSRQRCRDSWTSSES